MYVEVIKISYYINRQDSISYQLQLFVQTSKHYLTYMYKQGFNKASTTNYGIKTLKFQGAKLFNKLSKDVKEIESLNIFKVKLKIY